MEQVKNGLLKRAFFESGLSQREISKRTGVSEPIISLAVNGKYVLDELQKAKIAATLGQPVKALF